MAVLWMDGFDHYGTGAAGKAAMLDGVWAEMASNSSITNARSRTDTYALTDTSANRTANTRRVLGGAKTTVGVGGAWWLDSLPTSNGRFCFYAFQDAANVNQVVIGLQTTGVIEVRRGGMAGTLLGQTANPVITAGAWQHVEVKAVFDNSAGAVEVRVNGVSVLSLTSVDTVQTTNVECSQVVLFTLAAAASPTTATSYVDDIFAWDGTGAQNNDFLGDRRVRTIFPDADTATEEWTATGATDGFDCINDAAPDDETTYISALPLVGSPPTPLTSIYGLQNPPAGVGSIAAVQTYVRMRKTEAGDTNVKVSLLSSIDEAAGADRAITEVYTYWTDVHELNPNTGTPWSESSLSAAQLQIKRTV